MNQETRSILTCSLVGAIIGWAMGVAQLIYIGSWELIYWAWMPLIPIYSAVGGGLYGMIFGGGMSTGKRVEQETEDRTHSHAA